MEVDEGKQLAEGLIKQSTGGDTVTVRFLFGREFEYRPAYTLWLAANHSPKIRDDDDAIWNRIHRLPWNHVIPKESRDPNVKIVLRDPQQGGPAILTWLVQGCLAWQKSGLGVPPVVEHATRDLRGDMDPLRDFIQGCCVLDAQAE
ncbi:MAG TPA: DNA primase, partial [Chloroflexota bacterium]|nr:DNA primase [Chloroflexota bacterium]